MMINFANESTKSVAIILDHVATPEATQVLLDRQQLCGDAGVSSFPSVKRAANAMSKFIQYHQKKSESA